MRYLYTLMCLGAFAIIAGIFAYFYTTNQETDRTTIRLVNMAIMGALCAVVYAVERYAHKEAQITK